MKMATDALVPLVYQLQEGLNNFDVKNWAEKVDLQKFVSAIDFKTLGWIAVVVVGIIFILDLLTKPKLPFGRSLALSAANAWENNRDSFVLGNDGRGGRSLEPVVEVLDSIAEAVQKWETAPQDAALRNRALR